MSELICQRVGISLVPTQAAGREYVEGLPKGTDLRVKVTQGRNLQWHRKYFALINWSFDEFEPAEQPEFIAKYGMTPEKNRDAFRKDIMILAGFGLPIIRVNGEVRMEAKSMSFASMTQDAFEELYEATLKVLYKRIFQGKGYTEDEMRSLADQLGEFG